MIALDMGVRTGSVSGIARIAQNFANRHGSIWNGLQLHWNLPALQMGIQHLDIAMPNPEVISSVYPFGNLVRVIGLACIGWDAVFKGIHRPGGQSAHRFAPD